MVLNYIGQMDRQHNHRYMYKLVHDSIHDNLLQNHMNQDMDLCIFVVYKLLDWDILDLVHILVDNLVAFLQMILDMSKLAYCR